MVRAMNRAITLATPFAAATGRVDPLDVARSLIVLGCAAALIFAPQPFLPF
jgi:hypothetical protein